MEHHEIDFQSYGVDLLCYEQDVFTNFSSEHASYNHDESMSESMSESWSESVSESEARRVIERVFEGFAHYVDVSSAGVSDWF